MNIIYRDVVDVCLSEDSDKSKNINKDFNLFISVTLRFARIVVKQLAKC